MKKLAALAVLSAASVLASHAGADVVLINGDDSDAAKLCIQAVENGLDGIGYLERREIRCNGKSLPVFVAHINKLIADSGVEYKFKMRDETELTQLCVAAVRSDAAYESTRRALFGDAARLDDEVLCNGMPISEFARKYRSRNVTASL